MNEYRISQKSKDLIDIVKIINQFAIFSTIQNDIIFNLKNLKNPIFCGGLVKNFNKNVYNLKRVEQVGYISHEQEPVIEISSNLIVKLPEVTNFRLIAILPYASYAMKILRTVDPKLGQNILIIGSNIFSKLLTQLIRLSGAVVFILDTNDQSNINSPGSDSDKNYIIKLEYLKNQTGKFNSVILTTKLTDQINKILNSFDSNIIYQPSEINLFDRGFNDPNYIRGVKYPYSYIRWHFQENLKFFINLIENEIITIDFLQIEKINIDSIRNIEDIIRDLQKESLYLFEMKEI